MPFGICVPLHFRYLPIYTHHRHYLCCVGWGRLYDPDQVDYHEFGTSWRLSVTKQEQLKDVNLWSYSFIVIG